MIRINLLNAFPGDDPTCKRIPLTQGQATLVSEEDYDRLNQHPWQAVWSQGMQSFYAKRTVQRDRKKINLLVHREIMGLEPGDPRHVHHVNGDTLDNRRENLKTVTPLEHQDLHRNDPRKDASKYGIGVYRQRNGRFEARAQIDGKQNCLGTYDTPEEAQKARRLYIEITSIPLFEH